MTDPDLTTNTAALFDAFDKEMMSGLKLNSDPSVSSLICEFLNFSFIVAFYSFHLQILIVW